MPSGASGVIRDADDDDADAVVDIFAFYVSETTTTFETEPPSAEQWRTRWTSLRQQGWPVLVAELEGVVVGFAYVGPWRDKPGYCCTMETTGYVAPAARGQGLGARLASETHRRAQTAGAREIVAVIADSGDPASLTLHCRLGFADVGLLREVGRKFGRWIDVRLLQKSVAPGRD